MKFPKFKYFLFNILFLSNFFNPLSYKVEISYAAESPEEILENYINQIPQDKFYIRYMYNWHWN